MRNEYDSINPPLTRHCRELVKDVKLGESWGRGDFYFKDLCFGPFLSLWGPPWGQHHADLKVLFVNHRNMQLAFLMLLRQVDVSKFVFKLLDDDPENFAYFKLWLHDLVLKERNIGLYIRMTQVKTKLFRLDLQTLFLMMVHILKTFF